MGRKKIKQNKYGFVTIKKIEKKIEVSISDPIYWKPFDRENDI